MSVSVWCHLFMVSRVSLHRVVAVFPGQPHFLRVPTGREKSVKNIKKQFKVREKSGNFDLSQKNLKFWKKSGNFMTTTCHIFEC